MKYIPENTQIKALNTAKSTVCNVLSEVMVATAVPPGLEAGFTQPVMTTLTQLMEYRDTWAVQIMDKAEGSREPQATATQLCHGETPQQTEKPHRSRLPDLGSSTRQESLDKVRKGFTKQRLVVNKVELPASSATSPPQQEPSPKRRDWHKRTKKEHLAACDVEKARSIARTDKEYAKLMEER